MKKTVKKYVYEGLGFPVELHDVEMVKIDGDFHPKIDIKKISTNVVSSLVLQEKRLTGNQIKFIRSYFSMSLRDFAKIMNESHMAVKKWEDFNDKPTNMDKNIEIMLRLHLYDRIISGKKATGKLKLEFYDQFLNLKTIFSRQSRRVNAQKTA